MNRPDPTIAELPRPARRVFAAAVLAAAGLLLAGCATPGGSPTPGATVRVAGATVCIGSLGRRGALGKTCGLLNEGAVTTVDWDAFFGTLTADAR